MAKLLSEPEYRTAHWRPLLKPCSENQDVHAKVAQTQDSLPPYSVQPPNNHDRWTRYCLLFLPKLADKEIYLALKDISNFPIKCNWVAIATSHHRQQTLKAYSCSTNPQRTIKDGCCHFNYLHCADSHSASQQIPCILWNQKVHYHGHNSPLLGLIMSQTNEARILMPYFYKLNFHIILPSVPSFPKWCTPLWFSG